MQIAYDLWLYRSSPVPICHMPSSIRYLLLAICHLLSIATHRATCSSSAKRTRYGPIYGFQASTP